MPIRSPLATVMWFAWTAGTRPSTTSGPTIASPGWRIVVPWAVEGLPGGTVQLDIVTGEPLPVPPVVTEIPLVDGSTTAVKTASRELSLAWKILWLVTDINAQGKDLYDAVLLAEQLAERGTPLQWPLLHKVIAASDPRSAAGLSLESIGEVHDHEWKHFPAEYPWITATPKELQSRLQKALAPTFDFRPASSFPIPGSDYDPI
jgi:hypothetical protein